jgi:light-regulated signal transduction histidine kinase (bacteriophytochrome)
MGCEKPTYEELEARLTEAEKALNALKDEKIDALIGKRGVYLLRLKEVEKALEESIHEMTEYAYALTHNLKSPLRAIHNYVNFLFEDLADTLKGEPKKYLEGIREAITISNKQFEDLETLYNIKNHRVRIQPLDMRELLDEMAYLYKNTAGRQLLIAPQWPDLWSEKFLLRQILLNLITNGFKFNRADIKRVEIGWHPAADESIDIFVRDNGIGIASAHQDQIFNIFKRLHTDREFSGTGIGLAIVKKAAQKLGVTLRLESMVGEGSTFYVNLPKVPSENNRT